MPVNLDVTRHVGIASATEKNIVSSQSANLASPPLFLAMIPQNLLTARIEGKLRTFPTMRETFDALVAEYRRLRERGSSTSQLVNDAYGQIVAMGWAVVPLLLREVEKQSGHWFEALTWITREDFSTPKNRGNVRELRRAWLEWEARNGHLPAGNLSGPMVPRQPISHSGN